MATTLSKPKVVKEWPYAGARGKFYPAQGSEADQVNDALSQFVKFFFNLEPRRREKMMEILNALNDVQETLEDHTHVKADITDLPTITTTPTADAVPQADGSGDLADGWIPASAVTQHQAALSIAGSQVDSGTLPDARIQQSGVTQHEQAIDNIAASVVFGSGGARIRNNAGVIEARNNADLALAAFGCANIAIANFQQGSGSTFGALGATPASQLPHIADANTAHSTASFADVDAALDAIGVILNSSLVTGETFGFRATS